MLSLSQFSTFGAPLITGPGTPALSGGNVVNLQPTFTDFVAASGLCPGGSCQLTYAAILTNPLTRRDPGHVHAPPPAGTSPADPVLPVAGGTCPAPCFDLPVVIDPGGLGGTDFVCVDPVVATGYDYTIQGAADVFFDSVLIPEQGALTTGTRLQLIVGASTFELLVGSAFDFFDDAAALDVAAFSIRDIDPSFGLDPDDPTAFVTGLMFEGAAGLPLTATTAIDVIMSPFTVDTNPPPAGVPSPDTWSLLALGLAGVLGVRCRSAHGLARRGRQPVRAG